MSKKHSVASGAPATGLQRCRRQPPRRAVADSEVMQVGQFLSSLAARRIGVGVVPNCDQAASGPSPRECVLKRSPSQIRGLDEEPEDASSVGVRPRIAVHGDDAMGITIRIASSQRENPTPRPLCSRSSEAMLAVTDTVGQSAEGPSVERRRHPSRRRRVSAIIVLALAVSAGIGAAVADCKPTGTSVVDPLYTALFAVFVTCACSRASRKTLLIFSVVAVAMSRTWLEVPAGAALLIAVRLILPEAFETTCGCPDRRSQC